MYQGRDIVAGRPGQAIAPPAVQPGGRIAPLRRSQEPLILAHEPDLTPHELAAT